MVAGGALSRDEALLVWPLIEPLVKRATDRDFGRSSPETIKQLIQDDKALLWVDKNLKMALVTTIEVYPTGKKSLLCRVCAGEDLNIPKSFIETLKNYAKDIGCECIEIFGRDGWLKVFKDMKKDYSVMRLDI